MAVFNRILAALLALALLLGGLLATTEIVLAGVGHAPWLVPHTAWASWLSHHNWDTAVVRAGLVALILIGLLLLAPAWRRGKPRSIPLADDNTKGVTVTVSRRDLEHTLAAAARRVSGITRARAKVTRNRARIHATTTTRTNEHLNQHVTTAVTDALTDLGLADTLRPQTNMKVEKSR